MFAKIIQKKDCRIPAATEAPQHKHNMLLPVLWL